MKDRPAKDDVAVRGPKEGHELQSANNPMIRGICEGRSGL